MTYQVLETIKMITHIPNRHGSGVTAEPSKLGEITGPYAQRQTECLEGVIKRTLEEPQESNKIKHNFGSRLLQAKLRPGNTGQTPRPIRAPQHTQPSCASDRRQARFWKTLGSNPDLPVSIGIVYFHVRLKIKLWQQLFPICGYFQSLHQPKGVPVLAQYFYCLLMNIDRKSGNYFILNEIINLFDDILLAGFILQKKLVLDWSLSCC